MRERRNDFVSELVSVGSPRCPEGGGKERTAEFFTLRGEKRAAHNGKTGTLHKNRKRPPGGGLFLYAIVKEFYSVFA